MTFSLVVREGASFGSVICSSSPAVGARCVHLRDGVGAVHSQNITDPRLGPRLLDLLASGLSASAALQRLVAGLQEADYRQLIAVDARGTTAIHSGSHALGIVGEYQFGAHAAELSDTTEPSSDNAFGTDSNEPGIAPDLGTDSGAAAAGNMLANPDIPRLLVTTWQAANGRVEDRLMAAFTAAVEAGGEAGPVHSAALTVVTGRGWPTTDLRVDWSDDPLTSLYELYERWMPERDDYILRALDPARSPGYGVPGDER